MVLLFHFKDEKAEASKWQDHSFSMGVSYFQSLMTLFFLTTLQAAESISLSKRTERHKQSTTISSLPEFLIITSKSLMATLMILEIGLTSYPIPFMKTQLLLHLPFPHTLSCSLSPAPPAVFPFSKSSYKQPFGNNFEVHLLPGASVFCNLEVRDCVFSACHVYASACVGT